MASTTDNNYGLDSSKLQSANAPPPVTGAGGSGPGAGAGGNAGDVGAGYGGYAESTGLNNNNNNNAMFTNANNTAGTGAGTGAGATGTHPPPPPPPASGGARAGAGYDAGAGAGTGATTGGGYGATGGNNYGGGTGTGAGGGTTQDKAKVFGKRAYNRFIKPGGRAGAAEKEWDIPLAILAIFVPPLAVFLKVGLITVDFVINVCLTILVWFPGVIHAWYVIFIQRGAKSSRGAAGPVDSTRYNADTRRDKTL